MTVVILSLIEACAIWKHLGLPYPYMSVYLFIWRKSQSVLWLVPDWFLTTPFSGSQKAFNASDKRDHCLLSQSLRETMCKRRGLIGLINIGVILIRAIWPIYHYQVISIILMPLDYHSLNHCICCYICLTKNWQLNVFGPSNVTGILKTNISCKLWPMSFFSIENRNEC